MGVIHYKQSFTNQSYASINFNFEPGAYELFCYYRSENGCISLEDTLALLVVHGTLHLLGYEHDTPENRAEMWAEQAIVLKALHIDTSIVPSLEESKHD